MEKLTIQQVVLVEGKYDKAKLDALVDSLILPVHGFSVFTDRPLQTLIRQLAAQQGIIVLMDSDAAGFKIRGFLNGLVPKEQITHVYIPDVEGKERRKKAPSKEGTLGVEGMTLPVLVEAFAQAGVLNAESAAKTPITKADLFLLGLTGVPQSAQLREKLYQKLNFPAKISTNSALALLNQRFSLEELQELLYQLG